LAIVRTAVPRGPTFKVNVEGRHASGSGRLVGPAGVVARSLVMVALAAFAILVLLPAAIAAQATVPM
jgi:hypothetical protein